MINFFSNLFNIPSISQDEEPIIVPKKNTNDKNKRLNLDNNNYIDQLPVELLLRIFKLFSSDQIYKLGLVSRTWLDLSGDKSLGTCARLPTLELNNIIAFAKDMMKNIPAPVEYDWIDIDTDKHSPIFKKWSGNLRLDKASNAYSLVLDNQSKSYDFELKEDGILKDCRSWRDISNFYTSKEKIVQGYKVITNQPVTAAEHKQRVLKIAQIIFAKLSKKEKKT